MVWKEVNEMEIAVLIMLFVMGIGGWVIDHRDRRDRIDQARAKCKAKEPRFKSREDYWAA